MIRSGALVAFPTETVYGLGADATNGEAVARVFDAKGRPSFNPLIVHVLGLEQAEVIGSFSPMARRLADAFWPGPLTLVVPRRDATGVSDLVSAGLSTIALRAPDHPIARALLDAAQRPIAAPSANRSGHVSATRAEHVASDLGDKAAVILDGGPTAHGLEFDGSEPHGRSASAIATRRRACRCDREDHRRGAGAEEVWQRPIHLSRATSEPLRAASPTAAQRVKRGDPTRPCWRSEQLAISPARAIINLSPSGDLVEAAANLFAALRELDASGAETIAVTPVPAHGLGEAINDRLERAAAPRG